jgi:hypothetical protein
LFFGAAQRASAAAPFQQFLLHTATPLVGDDFDYAVADWNGDARPDLFAIKRQHTGSGTIEVHILSGASNYQQFLLHTATPLVGDDFDYAVTDWNHDDVPDLVAIKRRNTGSGRIEVHILSGSSNFQQFLLHTATPLVGDDFDYVVGDWNDFGTPDLVAIKRLHTGSGTTEVHVLSGESGFQTFVLQTATPLVGDDFDFALTDWDFDLWPDLVAVKRTNTGTGTIEAHILSRNAQSFVLHTGTPLVGDDFDYAFADYDGDRAPDLFAIKRLHTGSGTIEVHVLGAPAPAPPAAPSASIAGHTSSSITVRFTDNATGFHGIRIERQVNSGSGWTSVWNAYPYTGPPTQTSTNTSLNAGTTYCYRAVAYNTATRLSSASPTVCGTTDPSPPNLLVASGVMYLTDVNDPSTDAPPLHAGDAFAIAWDECNFGQATAGAHATALFLRPTGASWSQVATVQVPAMAPGSCVREYTQFTSGLAADQYDAGVTVDSTGVVAESSEADNVALMGFNILQ